MRRQIFERELVGKTIHAITHGYGGRVALRFTDDTFALLTIYYGYEPEISFDDPVDIQACDSFLVEAGILTREEFARIRGERKALFDRKAREERRKAYERLKQEFDVPPAEA